MSANRRSGSSFSTEDEKEEPLLPPNLIWKLAFLVHHRDIEFSTCRVTRRFRISIHFPTKGKIEAYHVNFRDFQAKFHDQMCKLPNPYEYLDHIGSYFVQDKCLYLEVHFTSEEQIKRCLDGIDGAGMAEKVNDSLRFLMGARQTIVFQLKLVVCSSIDQKFRFVTHENTGYAYNLVYTPNPTFTTVYIRCQAAYKQIRSSYNELLKFFPDFFGGTTDENLQIAGGMMEQAIVGEPGFGDKLDVSSDVSDRELSEIAEKVSPKRWQALGMHMDLEFSQLERIEIDNKGNILNAIVKMLIEAKKKYKPTNFRKALSIALYQSHQVDLALRVNPFLKVDSIPMKVPDIEDDSSKLCFVHGELRFYDKGLADKYLGQMFWSKMKDIVAPVIGEKLAPYSLQVGLAEVGSLIVKVSIASFNGCLRLAIDISSGAFVADIETILKDNGYKESLQVELKLNGAVVDPQNCYSLYIEALHISMAGAYQTLVEGRGINDHPGKGRVKKFKKVLSHARSHGQPSSIVEAIKANDCNAIKSLLSQGADPNEFINGHTPLHTSAIFGKDGIVEVLVRNGANIDIKTTTEEEYTPLHLAAHSGHLPVVKVLVDLGANVDSRSHCGKTPLRLAAAEGYADIAEYLLSKDADPNTQDLIAATPLHAAAGLNRKSVVEVLINSGADFTIPDNRMSTPVHEALKTRDVDLLKLVLLKNPQLIDEFTVKDIEPPLTVACKIQSMEIVKFLLAEAHANPNVENKDHLTPLALASVLENVKLIELLVNHGAAPSKISQHFGSVLHLSAKEGKVRATEKLIELGVPSDLLDDDGYSPLRDAVIKQQHGTVGILLKAGASIRVGTPPGKLPLLHIAARNNDVDTLEILLSHNCDIYETPVDGSTALHHATSCGKSEAIHFLCSQTALLNVRSVAGITPLYTAVRQKNVDSAMEILVYNPDVNICSHNGHSPLLICIDFNAPHELVEQLIFHKAKIHYSYDIDPLGRAINLRSPIQLACAKGQVENVKVFLEANQSLLPEAPSSLHHLLLFSTIESGSSETLHVLLDHGVNPNALTNNESLSAIVKACFHGSSEMLKMLIDYEGDAEMPTGEMGITPLIVACEHDKIELVEILATRVDVNQQMKSNGYTALHKIASGGNPGIALLLLNNRALVDKVSQSGLTPLHVAASAGNMEVIDILLRYKANLNAQDEAGSTPLMRAVQDRRSEAAKKLIDAGASSEIQAIGGMHVLHFAAFFDDVKTMEILTQTCVSLNIQDESGMSPLHIATIRGHTAAVEALLSYGATVDIHNRNGFSPLHLAVAKDNVEIAELLIDKGASIELEVDGNVPADFSKSQEMNQLLRIGGVGSKNIEVTKETPAEITGDTNEVKGLQKTEYTDEERPPVAHDTQTQISIKREMDDIMQHYEVFFSET